jgi:hypothetical protein
MGKVELNISSNLQALMDKVDKLSGNVQKLTGQTDEFSQKSTQNFNRTTQSAKQLETEIKDQVKIIKDLEREYEKLGKTSSKHTKEQSASYKRLKGDIVVAKNELISMNQQQASMTSKGTQMFKQMGTAIAGVFAVGAVVAFSKESVAAYQTQIRSEAKLKQSLQGRSDIFKKLVSQANELERTTLFEDDDIMNAQAMLAINVKDEKQLKQLTIATLDLATAKGMDLASAAQAVNMATMGQSRALKSLGIELDLTGTKEENIIKVLDALSGKVGGQAVGALSEEERGLHEAAVAMDDFKKKWGEVVISLANTGATDLFIDTLDNIAGILDKIGNGNIWGKLEGLGEWIMQGAIVGQLLKPVEKWFYEFTGWNDWGVNAKENLDGVSDAADVFKESFMSIVKDINETPLDPWAGIYDSGNNAINYELLTTDRLIAIRARMTNKYGDLLLTGVENEDKANKEILDIVNKEIKWREDAAKKSTELQDLKNKQQMDMMNELQKFINEYYKEAEKDADEFQKSIDEDFTLIPDPTNETNDKWKQSYDDLTKYAQDAFDKTIEGQRALMSDQIARLEEMKKIAPQMAAQFDVAISEIKKQLEDLQTFGEAHPIAAALGIENEEQLSQIKDYVGQLQDFANQIIDQQVEATERIVEDQNQRIEEQQSLVDKEYADKQAGLANSYELEAANLKKMQAERDKAIKDRERMIKIQQTMSTVESGIALVSAAANIIKGFSSIPVVGVVLGLAAVAAMVAGFILMSNKAKDATKMEEGGPVYGLLTGKRHSQGGIPIEAEGGEYFVNRESTSKYQPLLEAINRDDRESMKLYFDRNFITRMPKQSQFDIDKSRKLGEMVNLMKKDKGQIIYGDGFIIEKIGGYTKKIHLN